MKLVVESGSLFITKEHIEIINLEKCHSPARQNELGIGYKGELINWIRFTVYSVLISEMVTVLLLSS